jgi:hypothetical protein
LTEANLQQAVLARKRAIALLPATEEHEMPVVNEDTHAQGKNLELVFADLEAQISAPNSRLKSGIYSRHIVGLFHPRLCAMNSHILIESNALVANAGKTEEAAQVQHGDVSRPQAGQVLRSGRLLSTNDDDMEPYLGQRRTVMKIAAIEEQIAEIQVAMGSTRDEMRSMLAMNQRKVEACHSFACNVSSVLVENVNGLCQEYQHFLEEEAIGLQEQVIPALFSTAENLEANIQDMVFAADEMARLLQTERETAKGLVCERQKLNGLVQLMKEEIAMRERELEDRTRERDEALAELEATNEMSSEMTALTNKMQAYEQMKIQLETKLDATVASRAADDERVRICNSDLEVALRGMYSQIRSLQRTLEDMEDFAYAQKAHVTYQGTKCREVKQTAELLNQRLHDNIVEFEETVLAINTDLAQLQARNINLQEDVRNLGAGKQMLIETIPLIGRRFDLITILCRHGKPARNQERPSGTSKLEGLRGCSNGRGAGF